MSYIDNLQTEDLEDLSEAANPYFSVFVRLDKLNDAQKRIVSRVDSLIANAPKLSKDTVIYKAFEGEEVEDFRAGGPLVDKGYFTGGKSKPSGSVILKVTVPSGTPVIEVPEGYILPRGIKLNLEATEDGPIPAKVTGFESEKITLPKTNLGTEAGIFLAESGKPDSILIEFHLLGQHNQKAHGHDQGGDGNRFKEAAGKIGLDDDDEEILNENWDLLDIGKLNVLSSRTTQVDATTSFKAMTSAHKLPTNMFRGGEAVFIMESKRVPKNVGGTYQPSWVTGSTLLPVSFIRVKKPDVKDTPYEKMLHDTRAGSTIISRLGYEVDHKLKNPSRKDIKLRSSLDNSSAVKGWKTGLTSEDKATRSKAKYNTRDRELFARAYNQWVVSKSSDPVVKKQFNRFRKESKLQWSDGDFKPISSEFDRLFKERGLT